jgi:hypothetical protein
MTDGKKRQEKSLEAGFKHDCRGPIVAPRTWKIHEGEYSSRIHSFIRMNNKPLKANLPTAILGSKKARRNNSPGGKGNDRYLWMDLSF